MYWNNPIQETRWPGGPDLVSKSFHQGRHCLFWDPAIGKDQIRYQQRLTDICAWANSQIQQKGLPGFLDDPGNHYDIANLVKLNIWVTDIRKQGIVKPVLTFYDGQEKLGINNGESRLRALERIPSITSLSGFIATHQDHAHQFSHLEAVRDLDHMAEFCKAEPGQLFMFTLTDQSAPYGIFWYEYDSALTRAVTPGQDACLSALRSYLEERPNFHFDPAWFDHLVNWNI
jgi:hypothetical protein